MEYIRIGTLAKEFDLTPQAVRRFADMIGIVSFPVQNNRGGKQPLAITNQDADILRLARKGLSSEHAIPKNEIKVTGKCLTCGTAFPGKVNRKFFCSRSCYLCAPADVHMALKKAWLPSKMTCSVCGETGHNSTRHLAPEANNTKTCCGCKKTMPLSNFHIIRDSGRKSLYRERPQSRCKTCSAEACRVSYRSSFAKRFAALLRADLRRKDHLTVDWCIQQYEKQEGRCFYTGIFFSLDTGSYAISLDRKDNTLGYTQDNTVLCLWIINSMKRALPLSEFLNLCRLVAKNGPP